MQQPQLTTYADISEVRTLTGAATCNQLLSEGWVLLAVDPLRILFYTPTQSRGSHVQVILEARQNGRLKVGAYG